MGGGQLDTLPWAFFFFFDLFKWTKGATFAPLNTKGNSWKIALPHCTEYSQTPIISKEALGASVSFM